tara:strand:- start:1173 stop:1448 length:276 start_codon:yes stop_codon:yes gene_type:complete
MKVGLLAIVNGRVQGVGFRYFVCRKARRLNLLGWVRNRPDGKVEALAEGEQSAVKEWSLAIKKGPSGSRVEGWEIVRRPYTNSFNRFKVIQ